MEKLRQAGPQTRATRDQRRRARLKDKHQIRVASGQKIPETGENIDENGLLSPTKTDAEDEPISAQGGVSEGEDIADRAASLLQGLRSDADAPLSEVPSRDESLRVRRRRESADDERARRRARRRAGATSTDGSVGTVVQHPIVEESEAPEDGAADRISEERSLPSLPPVTVIVPPSPTASEKE